MNPTKFDKPLLRVLRQEIDMALKAVGDKYGMEISAGNASFAAKEAHFKVSLKLRGADGQVFDAAAESFKHHAWYVGLKPEHLGQSFTVRDKVYTISGFDERARTYAILAKDSNDTVYKFRAVDVVKALGLPVNPPVPWAQ
jgi:hypothetical protein